MWMSSKSINYLKCFLNIMVQVYFFFYYSVSFMPIQPSIRNIIQDKEMWYTRISIGISEETFHFNIFVINKDPIRKSMRSVFYTKQFSNKRWRWILPSESIYCHVAYNPIIIALSGDNHWPLCYGYLYTVQ